MSYLQGHKGQKLEGFGGEREVSGVGGSCASICGVGAGVVWLVVTDLGGGIE